MEEPFTIGAGYWSLQTLKEIAHQAAEGLTFVHHRSCVHKDIKPNNFVVRKGMETGEPKWICKLTDLGFSNSATREDAGKMLEMKDWVAPELLNAISAASAMNKSQVKYPFSQKSDVWSFGRVLYFMFTKASPFIAERVQEELAKISQSAFRVDLLVVEMVQREADKRPNMNNVVITIRNWQPSEDRPLAEVDTIPKKPKTF